jgi:hypothetical protein
MLKKYKIKGLALPFKKANSTVIGLGVSGFLFYLSFNAYEIDFSVFFIGLIASIIFCATLSILFAYEAIEINFDKKSWIKYTDLLGLKAGINRNSAEDIQYVLLSEIEYRDNVTPLYANDVYYIVYIIFDGDCRQSIIETSNRKEAEERAMEVASLWSINFETASHVD